MSLRRGARLAGASDVWRVTAELRTELREHFVMFSMDVRHRVVAKLFRQAILDAAAAMIIVHNHPSGDTSPSRDDIALTTRLREVAELVGIPILDHVIVADTGYTSLAERGWR